MKTKREMFSELTPIEFANMLREEVIIKQLSKWTKNGLYAMQELWHKYYTNDAHRLICVCILTYKEKDIDLAKLEIAIR